MTDRFDLHRFIEAQRGTYEAALAEVTRGRKESHWMWFVFPQIAGLGSSAMARRYAIASLEEARAYLDHPLLGPRLTGIVAALQTLPAGRAVDVFGPVDAAKLRSSLTLFTVAEGPPIFAEALDRWFAGERDPLTLERLDRT